MICDPSHSELIEQLRSGVALAAVRPSLESESYCYEAGENEDEDLQVVPLCLTQESEYKYDLSHEEIGW